MYRCYGVYKVGFATKIFQEFNKPQGNDTALTGLSPGVLKCQLVQRWQLSFRIRLTVSVFTIKI